MLETEWKDVNNTPLEEDERFDVISALTPVAARWKEIGTAMRLTVRELDSINQERVEEGLRHVIVNWLKRNYNEKFGPPTWKWLVEIVANSAGGNDKHLADNIARKHLNKQEDLQLSYISSNDRHTVYYEPPDQGNVSQGHQLHCQSPSANYFHADISTFVEMSCYHGDISLEVAEERLIAQDNDCFLVRKSQSQKGKFALSVYYGEAMKHFVIRYMEDRYEVEGSQKPFSSLQDLINYYGEHPLSTDGMRLFIPCPCPRLEPRSPLTSNQDPPTAVKDDESTSVVSKSQSCPSTSYLSESPIQGTQEPTVMDSDDKEDAKNISTQECDPICHLEELCSDQPSIRHSDFMDKLPTNQSSPTKLRGWKRRFFKVMKGCIFYYENETSEKYKGYVRLSNSDIDYDEKIYTIQVTEKNGKFLVMKAPDIAKLNAWHRALKLEAAQPTY